MKPEKEPLSEPTLTDRVEVRKDVDGEPSGASYDAGPSLRDVMGAQDRDAEEFAMEFLKKVLRLRGVRVDREQFLRAELRIRGTESTLIEQAVSVNPAAAGVAPAMLDEIALSAIDFETRKSTALSFAAGLPGGFAMLGTVPADITQFYVHAFRVMQKVAYVYGWQSLLRDMDDIDDESLGKLAAFLGVMMGVGGASASVSAFAVQVARPAVQKKIASVALTKSAWYLPMKQTLRVIGVQVTKQSFAKTVTKLVPVVGGVVSGGLTFVTLRVQSKRLMAHLRELPPPNVDAEVYLAALSKFDSDSESPPKSSASGKAEKIGKSISHRVGSVRSNVTGIFSTKRN